MSELTLTLIKLGFLALLWLFVLSSVSVIRSDLFGAKVDKSRDSAQQRPVATPQPATQRRSRKAKKNAPTRLVITEGSNAGVSVPLEDTPILLGRGADATIRLDDDYVSTRHARFVPQAGSWYVEDLGSTNGTYVGSQRLTAPMAMEPGIQVRVGKTIVELQR